MRIIGVTGGVGCGKSAVLAELEKVCRCRVIRTDEVANDVKEPGSACYNEIVALLGEDVLEDARDASTDVTKPGIISGEADNVSAREGEAKTPRRIDRKKMAEKIFADEALLKKVNAVLHPAVRKYVVNAIAEESARGERDVLFIEAALLIESGYVSAKKRTRRAEEGTEADVSGTRRAEEGAEAEADDARRETEGTEAGADNAGQAAGAAVVLDELWYVYAPEEVRAKRLRENRGYDNAKIRAIMAKQLTEEQFREGSDFVLDNGRTLKEAVERARERINEIMAK